MSKSYEHLAELNKQRVTEKVRETLHRMKRAKHPINMSTVSEKAGIARKTLYNREDLKLMVEEAQAFQRILMGGGKPERKKKSDNELKQTIDQLRATIKEMKEHEKMILTENERLQRQNSILQEKMADLEERLFAKNKLIAMSKQDI